MVRFAQLVALILLAACAVADSKNDVRCHEIAFSRSVENNDIDAFRNFLDEDARFVGNAVLTGPDEIVTAWKTFFLDDGPAIMWRPQFVEVLKDGDLALTRGPYRLIGKDADGNLVEHWGTFNSVWRRNVDGEWRVIFDAGSEAAKPPDEETRAVLEQETDC